MPVQCLQCPRETALVGFSFLYQYATSWNDREAIENKNNAAGVSGHCAVLHSCTVLCVPLAWVPSTVVGDDSLGRCAMHALSRMACHVLCCTHSLARSLVRTCTRTVRYCVISMQVHWGLSLVALGLLLSRALYLSQSIYVFLMCV